MLNSSLPEKTNVELSYLCIDTLPISKFGHSTHNSSCWMCEAGVVGTHHSIAKLVGISEAAAGVKKPRVYWGMLLFSADAKFKCIKKLPSPSKSRTTLNLPIFVYSTVESALVADSYQKMMYNITSPEKPGKIPATTKAKTQKNHVEANNHIYIESLSFILQLEIPGI